MKKLLFTITLMISLLFAMPVMAETIRLDSDANRPMGPGEIEYVEKQPLEPELPKGPGIQAEMFQAPETQVPETGVNRWNLDVNEDEKELLAKITMLEAGGESDIGQQAVIEVILNRVYSPEYPDTVTGVLSQVDSGYVQFSTWKNRNLRSATPTAQVTANVNAVLKGETNILPYETVYFSRGGENRRVQAIIGRHIFCNR